MLQSRGRADKHGHVLRGGDSCHLAVSPGLLFGCHMQKQLGTKPNGCTLKDAAGRAGWFGKRLLACDVTAAVRQEFSCSGSVFQFYIYFSQSLGPYACNF